MNKKLRNAVKRTEEKINKAIKESVTDSFDMEYWNSVYRFSKEKFINDLKHQLIYKGSLENI